MQTLLDEFDTTKARVRESRLDLISKIDSIVSDLTQARENIVNVRFILGNSSYLQSN